MFNRFSDPFNIPDDYLAYYAAGLTTLQLQANVFYTPAIIISVLEDLAQLQSPSFQSWLFCFTCLDIKALLKDFKKAQLDFLIDFLRYIDDLDQSYLDTQEIKACINTTLSLDHHQTTHLIKAIKDVFKGVTLGGTYTLAEEDYFDTAHCHFDEACPLYFMSQADWDKREIENISNHHWWLDDEIEDAIQCIQQHRKMRNRFPHPLHIPLEYMNVYHTGFTFLTGKAYLFYTPSLLIYVLNDVSNMNSNAFSHWLFRLVRFETSDLLKYFNQHQSDLLLDCLRCLYCLNYLDYRRLYLYLSEKFR